MLLRLQLYIRRKDRSGSRSGVLSVKARGKTGDGWVTVGSTFALPYEVEQSPVYSYYGWMAYNS